MGLLLTLIAGLVLWIVLWGTSLMKSFDAFLIAMLLVLLAATARIIAAVPARRPPLSAAGSAPLSGPGAPSDIR